MKNTALIAPLAILLALTTGLRAGSLSSSISSESLVTAPHVEAVSAGLNYDSGQRSITSGSGDTRSLYTRSYSAMLGYDITDWCTIFATLGRSEARTSKRNNYGDGKTKWSLGVNANLWHVNIEHPPLFTGRISIKPTLEYAQFNSTIENNPANWTDISGALFLNYEKTIEDPKYSIFDFYGYTLYAGPAFSILDGDTGSTDTFNESQKTGIIGGLDFFITKYLSLGVQAQSFDEMSYSGNVRYHF